MYGSRDIELTPDNPLALCDLADVKAALGVSGAAQDALLNGLTLAASRAIETYCGKLFTERTIVETRHALDHAAAVVLTYYPARNLTAVSQDGTAQTLADFELYGRNATVARVDSEPMLAGKWRFTYQSGYAAGSLPAELSSAALLMTAHLYETHTRTAPDSAISRERVEDVGETEYRAPAERTLSRNGAALPVNVALMLAPFVKEF